MHIYRISFLFRSPSISWKYKQAKQRNLADDLAKAVAEALAPAKPIRHSKNSVQHHFYTVSERSTEQEKATIINAVAALIPDDEIRKMIVITVIEPDGAEIEELRQKVDTGENPAFWAAVSGANLPEKKKAPSGSARRGCFVLLLFCGFCCLNSVDKHGGYLEQVAADAVVSYFEDRSGIVFVDGDNALAVLHTGLMLNSTGNAQSNVDAGMYGLTGLAYLMVGGDPACVDASTGRSHNAAQDFCKLGGKGDALFNVLTDAATDGNDYVGTDQIDQLLGGLDHL